MRIRNIKNKNEIIKNSNLIIEDAFSKKGKWLNYFKNDNPIHLEIGMGKGKLIQESALNNPNINYIGLETNDNVLAMAVKRLNNQKIDNLCLVLGNANELDNIFSHEIDLIYLNFSDPWPKNKHIKKILTNPIFLEKYKQVFKNKKHLKLKTDNKDFFTYSLQMLIENGYIVKTISLDLAKEKIENITTEYEEKFRKKNNPIYYIEVCSKEKIKE